MNKAYLEQYQTVTPTYKSPTSVCHYLGQQCQKLKVDIEQLSWILQLLRLTDVKDVLKKIALCYGFQLWICLINTLLELAESIFCYNSTNKSSNSIKA